MDIGSPEFENFVFCKTIWRNILHHYRESLDRKKAVEQCIKMANDAHEDGFITESQKETILAKIKDWEFMTFEQFKEQYETGLEQILYEVYTKAREHFKECPGDFCVQHIGETSIVFGSTNRLIWSIHNGFVVDMSYCTETFIDHAKKIKRR